MISATSTLSTPDTSAPYVDLLIVGGGLAGLAVADAVLRESPSLRVHLLEAASPGAGASAVPQAMVHPFPGLSLSPKPGYLEAFAWMSQWLEQWATSNTLHSPLSTLHWKTSILRPLFLQETASQRLLRSFEKSSALYDRQLQVQHLSARQVQELYPALCPTDGGIQIAPAYAVDMPTFLQHVTQTLQQRGLCVFPQTQVLQFAQHGDKWLVTTTSGHWYTEHLLLAVGSALRDWFPHLPLVLTGGELLAVSPPAIFSNHPNFGLPGLVSYRGHIVPWPGRPWMLGATYWNEDPGPGASWFSWTTQTPQTARVPDGVALRQQLSSLCPVLAETLPQQVWWQCRTVLHPDREPVVGNVPSLPRVHILGGLASKGLLLASWLAHRWVHHWLYRELLPAWAHTARFSEDMWNVDNRSFSL